MNELFVMRRANGDLFTKQVGGKVVLPVWSGRGAVERSRERNPELLTYFAAPLDRNVLTRASREGTSTEFFLLVEGDPSDFLTSGRTVSSDEILSLGQQPTKLP